MKNSSTFLIIFLSKVIQMKKFLSVLVFAIFILSMNFCSANYYDDSPDYVYITTGQQGDYYFYLPSLSVQEYNPPHYQIAGHFIHYGGYDGKTLTNIYITVRYNWHTKETFRLNNGYWKKSHTKSSDNAAHRERKFEDVLFSAAYGMNFYGY